MIDEVPEVVHARYATSDAAEAREFMSVLYGVDLKVCAINRQPWQMTFDQLQVGPVVAVNLDMPGDLRFQLTGRDEFVITTMLGGVADIERAAGRECFGRGDVYLAVDPVDDDPCRCQHAHAYTVNLLRSVVDEVATDGGDTRTPGWRFLSRRPIAGAARRWVRGVRLFRDIVDRSGPAASPLVIGPASRLLAALALTTFPNTADIAPGERSSCDRRDAHPETLRRALAFIEANPDRDISAADIARSAWVTPRAIQLAFRRHLDTTPTAYLRQVRLHHAHQQLQAAAPDGDVTVTRVASDWGFASPSRFAAHYRAAYGQPPSQTLAR